MWRFGEIGNIILFDQTIIKSTLQILDRDKSEEENIVERSRVEKELNALHALSKWA